MTVGYHKGPTNDVCLKYVSHSYNHVPIFDYVERLLKPFSMKTLLAAVIILILSGCSSYDYVVESDYSYTGDFNKYDSFEFAQIEGFNGTVEEKEVIEKYVKNTLTAWGYSRETRKPGLIVFYSVFYEDFSFRGFNQPDFQAWLRSNYSDKDLVFKKDTLPDGSLTEALRGGARYYKEYYDSEDYIMREGTVLISFVDRRKRKTVWQGYASGVFGQDTEKNERIMRSAVIRIMDEYKLLAFGSNS